MRDLPGHQPEVEDVVEINKELCSDHSGCREQVYSPMEGRHWTRLDWLSPARWYKLCWPRQRGKTGDGDWLVVGLTSLARTDLQPRQ